MSYISYILLRVMAAIFSLLPFPLIYFISDLIRILLFKIFRYRQAVIQQNLCFCFPDIAQEELQTLTSKIQRNFCDILMESLKGISFDPEKLIPRFRLTNPELLEAYYAKGQSVIFYSQHYNNWEWGPICLGLQMKHHLTGIIKKLSNNHVHKYFAEGRDGNNVSVILTTKTEYYFKNHLDERIEGIVFIADQYPFNKKRQVDVAFFNKHVKFNIGAARLASTTDYPVISIDVHKVKRGHYEVVLTEICNKASDFNAQELTQKYASHLESLIIKDKSAWLWTHKRFKDILKY